MLVKAVYGKTVTPKKTLDLPMLLNAISVDLISNPRTAFVEELSDSCIELFGDHGLKIKPIGPGVVRHVARST